MISSRCELAAICGTCNASEAPWECCFWDEKVGGRCRFHDSPFHVPHRTLLSRDWAESLTSIKLEADSVLDRVRVKSPETLPSTFLPEVKLASQDKSRAMAIIREANVPIIAISLGEFYHGTRMLRRRLQIARTIGLRRFLHFDGQVLLTTDFPDELCEYFLGRPQELRANVEGLNPDFVTTPDSSCYHNIPAAISLRNIRRAIIATEYLAGTDAQLIGLALGSNTEQLVQHSQFLTRLGCRILAVPLYEFRRLGLHELARHRITWKGDRLVLADYYSSWSWFPFSQDATNAEDGAKKLARFLRNCQNSASQGVFV
jgi:hypothetical protein